MYLVESETTIINGRNRKAKRVGIKTRLMKKIFAFIILGLFAISCAKSRLVTQKTNSKKHEIETSYNGMLSKPILADLEIENIRKEVNYQGKLNLSMADLKLNAKQLFLATFSCDFVVDPIYTTTVTKENLRTKDITIKLTGLPAKYSKIYQVDSLPKSIGQFYALDNPIKRVEYINSIDENNPRIGVDITLGSKGLSSVQIDYPFAGEIMRGYFSAENFSKLRYHRLVAATDSDQDGFHITGLLL
jgi:hypothetical protein